MKSEIDDKLSQRERIILQMYRNPKSSDLRRQIRLSIQYAVGTGIFLVMGIRLENPLYSIIIYGALLLWMVLRLVGARKLVGVMPGIIDKYESEIHELKKMK
jgi:hypothetical protein